MMVKIHLVITSAKMQSDSGVYSLMGPSFALKGGGQAHVDIGRSDPSSQL